MKKLLLLLLLFAIPAQAQVLTPQGRLSLTSGVAVQTADVSATSSVYYVCARGNNVQINGTNLTIGSCNLTLTLTSGNNASGSVYDIVTINNSGTLAICTPVAWTSTTNRGTGAGTAEIRIGSDGLWENANTYTYCYNGATDYGSISAGNAKVVGSVYTTAAGQTSEVFAPAATAGGGAPVLGLYNFYNRERVIATSRDSSDWTYNSATYRAADNSNNNRVSWLDGLGQSQVAISYAQGVQPPVNNCAGVGVNIDTTTGTPSGGIGGYAFQGTATNNNDDMMLYSGKAYRGLGFHYGQAMEARACGTGVINFWSGTGDRNAITAIMDR